MKRNSKVKLLLNTILLVGIIVIILYLIKNSLSDILYELAETSLWIVIGVTILGTIYQLLEGKTIKELVRPYTTAFSVTDGFLASAYIAFYRIVTFGTGTLVSEVAFYKKKKLSISQGMGITVLHMIMYKVAVISYAVIGLLTQFTRLYGHSPKMIPFIIAGLALTVLIIVVLIALSSSVNLQVVFVVISNKLFKSAKIRAWIDTCNIQIYSLRETIHSLLEDRSALIRIYGWNMLKLAFWYVIPYFVLVQSNPSLDFLLVCSYTGFAVILSGVIPTPAGIGSFEFVYMLLFKPLVGTVEAASSILLYRFASFLLPFIFGTVYMIVEKRRDIKTELAEVRKEQVEEE